MTLVSPAFYPFLLGTLALSVAVGRRRRWAVLLGASYAFYAALGAPWSLAVLIGLTLVAWVGGRLIEAQPEERRRGRLLRGGVLAALGVLLALKYLAFLVENLNGLAGLLGGGAPLPAVPLLATVGLSYYTLQVVSYLVDVHDEVVPAEPHLGLLALHLAFFPKIVQGPIERAGKLLPQLRDLPAASAADLAAGAQLILWGLFQKLVVADALAPFVDVVYGDVAHHAGLEVLVATWLYAGQLYFDFAGYTDLALGVARLFGVRLTQNFNAPYLATSAADFWRRWHLSFSSWLQDYVFKRLQLEWRGWRTWGTPLALMATFVVSGLWHGATWSFVAWGALHGLYLAADVLWRTWRKPRPPPRGFVEPPWRRGLRILTTFQLVCLAWVLFRARTLGDAGLALRNLVTGLPASLAALGEAGGADRVLALGLGLDRLLLVGLLLLAAPLLRGWFRRLEAAGVPPAPAAGGGWPRRLALAALYSILFYLVAFGGAKTQGFLYAQF